MGDRAIHLPFNFVRQGDKTHGLILGQETGSKLTFGADMDFVMVKGDMIFRPHLVIQSNHCRGMGAAAIITSSSFSHITEWVEKGEILLDVLPIRKDGN